MQVSVFYLMHGTNKVVLRNKVNGQKTNGVGEPAYKKESIH